MWSTVCQQLHSTLPARTDQSPSTTEVSDSTANVTTATIPSTPADAASLTARDLAARSPGPARDESPMSSDTGSTLARRVRRFCPGRATVRAFEASAAMIPCGRRGLRSPGRPERPARVAPWSRAGDASEVCRLTVAHDRRRGDASPELDDSLADAPLPPNDLARGRRAADQAGIAAIRPRRSHPPVVLDVERTTRRRRARSSRFMLRWR